MNKTVSGVLPASGYLRFEQKTRCIIRQAVFVCGFVQVVVVVVVLDLFYRRVVSRKLLARTEIPRGDDSHFNTEYRTFIVYK